MRSDGGCATSGAGWLTDTFEAVEAPSSGVRPRVHFMGGDEVGWALDDDLAQTRAALAEVVDEVPLEDCDIVHSVWWEPLIDLPAGSLDGKRVVCQFSGEPARYFGLAHFHQVLSLVDRWVAQSQEAVVQLASLGISASHAPYAVDTSTFRRLKDTEAVDQLRERLGIPPDRYLIGNFSRDSEGRDRATPKLVKGPDVFCEVVRLAMDRGAPVHVVLAGPRRGWIRQRLGELSIPFTYVGQDTEGDDIRVNTLPRSELNELYNLVDLTLVASRSEGGPRAVLEAPAAGCKALSSRVGLSPDVLPPECIFDDPMEAAQIIVSDAHGGLLDGPAAGARKHVLARHTPSAVRERLLLAYADLPRVAKRRGRVRRGPGRARRLLQRLKPSVPRIRLGQHVSDELVRLSGHVATSGRGGLLLMPTGAFVHDNAPQISGKWAAVVAAEDVTTRLSDVRAVVRHADAVATDTLWTMSRLDNVESLPTAVIVPPDLEGEVAGDEVTVALVAADQDEGRHVDEVLGDLARSQNWPVVAPDDASVLVVRGLCPPAMLRTALRRGALVVHDGHPWVAELCGFGGVCIDDVGLRDSLPAAIACRAMYRRLLVRRTCAEVADAFRALARQLGA